MKHIRYFSLLLTIFIALLSGCCGPSTPKKEEVKSVIYMIGDGMGLSQITATMLHCNYSPLNMDRAHVVGLVKTYSANNRVTDSAAAGTALATGTKTNNGMLGIDPQGNLHQSVLQKAKVMGNSVGLVVTSHVLHATPAAFYAHVYSRNSNDSIMAQLLDSDIDVVFGGGKKFLTGREDGRDIEREFIEKGYRVVYDLDQATDISSGKIIALTADQHMENIVGGRGNYLPSGVTKAIEILENNAPKGGGFFLMVEGSQIDFAGHGNDIDALLAEMVDFDEAVGVAFDYADSHPGVLVIVLADHETGGLSIVSKNDDFAATESGLIYNFSTRSHSATMIPLLAYGTGAENFSRILDNTEVPKIIERLLIK